MVIFDHLIDHFIIFALFWDIPCIGKLVCPFTGNVQTITRIFLFQKMQQFDGTMQALADKYSLTLAD